jgi:hypothetical protein
MTNSKTSYDQLDKDFAYILEMKQTFDDAVLELTNDSVPFGPIICVENIAMVLDMLAFNMSKLIEFTDLIEKENEQIN